jgi:hypothetical protein
MGVYAKYFRRCLHPFGRQLSNCGRANAPPLGQGILLQTREPSYLYELHDRLKGRRLSESKQYRGELIRLIAGNHVGRPNLEVAPSSRGFGAVRRRPKCLPAWCVTTIFGGLDVCQTEVVFFDWNRKTHRLGEAPQRMWNSASVLPRRFVWIVEVTVWRWCQPDISQIEGRTHVSSGESGDAVTSTRNESVEIHEIADT